MVDFTLELSWNLKSVDNFLVSAGLPNICSKQPATVVLVRRDFFPLAVHCWEMSEKSDHLRTVDDGRQGILRENPDSVRMMGIGVKQWVGEDPDAFRG